MIDVSNVHGIKVFHLSTNLGRAIQTQVLESTIMKIVLHDCHDLSHLEENQNLWQSNNISMYIDHHCAWDYLLYDQ